MSASTDIGICLFGFAAVGCLLFAATASSGAPRTSATATPSATSYAMQVYDTKHAEGADEAKLAFDLSLARYEAGQATLEEVATWSERAREAHYSPTAPADHRDRMRRLEQAVQKRVTAGTATALDSHAVAYYRALAEAGAP